MDALSNKLYDIASRVIESQSREEAKNTLFGKDGINLNTKEHYNRLLSEFVLKKETIIKKKGQSFYFNLANNPAELFNIVFLGQFVIDQWEKEIKRLQSLKQHKEAEG